MGLLADAKSMLKKDPAARSLAEVMLLYPGFHALVFYRVSHWFYKHGRLFCARMVSQWGRGFTGIEIHPGATIGDGLFIDHGAGVVIGETAEIGNNVTLYHGVTLGGTGKDEGKRHPTIGDNVLIGTGCKVLGPITIGANSRIGANSVVLSCIPANATAIGKALLSGLGNDEIRALYADGLPRLTEQTVTDLDTLWAQLELGRAGGFATECEECTPQLACWALPLRRRQHVFSALSVSVPLFRYEEEKVNQVCQCLLDARTEIEHMATIQDFT